MLLRQLGAALLLSTGMLQATAQTPVLEFLESKVLSSASDTFGGISAAAMLPAGRMGLPHPAALLVCDHYPNGRKAVAPQSYAFFLTGDSVSAPRPFYGINGIEGIAYDPDSGRIFYCFESDSLTGFGWIAPDGKVKTLLSEPIPGPEASRNRGFEGICLNADGDLWLAPESGAGTDCSAAVLQFRLLRRAAGYDPAAAVKVDYPFERCSCLGSAQHFNGGLGNGVSEIIALPGRKDELLVLERCFSGLKADLKLYWAKLKKPGVFEKTLVFDFNDAIRPDNLEAMFWQEDKEGKYLVCISDDNYNRLFQKTEWVKLKFLGAKVNLRSFDKVNQSKVNRAKVNH